VPTIRVDPDHPDADAMEKAAAILRRGGLVAFPTETVYGLGAHALDEDAVRRVFQAKGRPEFNPLIVHVADPHGAQRLVSVWPDMAERLAAVFWPGPLTLVLPRHERVPTTVTGGLSDVAIRVPAHPVALAMLRAADLPVVAPSANPSAAISPTRAEHVERGMGDNVDLILDAGPTRLGIESTVVDLTSDPPRILRPGALAASEIEPFTGPLTSVQRQAGGPRVASPGMLDRHYAPRARLVLFGSHDRDKAANAARAAARDGRTVGALLLRPLDAPLHHSTPMPTEAAAYAARLFHELHQLDHLGCDLILAEQVPDGAAWDGVRDRLTRAATDASQSER
jgi:L-threonylcarbamoyladenylate synthase